MPTTLTFIFFPLASLGNATSIMIVSFVVVVFKEAKVNNVAVAYSGIFANVNKDLDNKMPTMLTFTSILLASLGNATSIMIVSFGVVVLKEAEVSIVAVTVSGIFAIVNKH